MKKILLITPLFLGFISISMTTGNLPNENNFTVDFIRYAKIGFFVTPGDYTGKDEGIEFIGIEIYQDTKNSLDENDNKKQYHFSDGFYRRIFYAHDLVDSLYSKAKKMEVIPSSTLKFKRLLKVKQCFPEIEVLIQLLFTATRPHAMLLKERIKL